MDKGKKEPKPDFEEIKKSCEIKKKYLKNQKIVKK
jgi:hypothetical protein